MGKCKSIRWWLEIGSLVVAPNPMFVALCLKSATLIVSKSVPIRNWKESDFETNPKMTITTNKHSNLRQLCSNYHHRQHHWWKVSWGESRKTKDIAFGEVFNAVRLSGANNKCATWGREIRRAPQPKARRQRIKCSITAFMCRLIWRSVLGWENGVSSEIMVLERWNLFPSKNRVFYTQNNRLFWNKRIFSEKNNSVCTN